eukprot:3661116-Pyramimonas_sp.AAC.1
MDGFPRCMRNRRRTSRHILWKCGIQNYVMNGTTGGNSTRGPFHSTRTHYSRQQRADHCS